MLFSGEKKLKKKFTERPPEERSRPKKVRSEKSIAAALDLSNVTSRRRLSHPQEGKAHDKCEKLFSAYEDECGF